MSLSSNALTSTGNALAWLRRPSSGTTLAADTALLELAINGVSETIIRYCQREFVSAGASDVARTFEYAADDGLGYLDFAPYDLRSVTSITLGGVTLVAGTGVGDGDYNPMPRNQTREGTYTYLTLRSYYALRSASYLYSRMLRTRDVVITGKWGMLAVPHDVELACLIAVADMYRNPEQVSSRGSGDFQISEVADNPGSAESLPYGARRLLDPFVRPVAG